MKAYNAHDLQELAKFYELEQARLDTATYHFESDNLERYIVALYNTAKILTAIDIENQKDSESR